MKVPGRDVPTRNRNPLDDAPSFRSFVKQVQARHTRSKVGGRSDFLTLFFAFDPDIRLLNGGV